MRLSLEHVQQRVRMWCKKILPTQVADDAVARAAVVPVGLHQPDVLVNSAVGAFHFRGSKVHGVHLLVQDYVNDLQPFSKPMESKDYFLEELAFIKDRR